MKPAVSVIVPVHNAEATIDSCVGSIASQSFSDIEIILVDDGSTDASFEKCEALAASDSRIRVIHKENGGVSSARNEGIGEAAGGWLMFVDSDDSLPEGAIGLLAGSIAGNEKAWLALGGFTTAGSSSQKTILPEGKENYCSLSDFFDETYTFDRCLFRQPWCKLFRKTGLRFPESVSYGEDMVYVTEYLATAPADAEFSVVKAPVYRYSVSADGLGGDLTSDKHIGQIFKLLPLYRDAIDKITRRIPDSRTAASLYHKDLVGRFCCRILTIFATRKTALMTTENIRILYSFMSKDRDGGIFSLRKGQVPNLLLQRIGSPSFTRFVYRLTECLPVKPPQRNPLQ